MQGPVSEAITQGQDTVDPAALAKLSCAYRCAALVAIRKTPITLARSP
jgi:hypothetical protein